MSSKVSKERHSHTQEPTLIRWCNRRDIAAMLTIDKQVFQEIGYWQKEDLTQVLQRQDSIGIVLEHNNQIVGFALYRLDKTFLQIIRYGILRDYQRLGFGRKLIDRLKHKLDVKNKRQALTIAVPDCLLSGHLHLQSCGFTCQDVIRKGWCDGADAYLFGWNCEGIKLSDKEKESTKLRLEQDELW